MISRETIDEVKNRLDIVDVISDFVSLKRSGQNYKALSPFNDEKTASFFVVPAKGIFKDFSSGKGGDAITFVMEHEGMNYTEAIRFLAKKYGVEIKEDVQSDELREQQSEREGLYILMNFAKDYYKANLFNTDEGKAIGLSYFHERGFNDRIMQKFELGYALDGWSNLMDESIKKNYNKDLLEKTGLVVKNEDGRTYDRFRGRVIFPMLNLSGKVIAFGARMMGKDKNQPKYINSPETEIYHKGNVLYGLYQAKNAIRQKDNCFLVEGYTDVISMHQSDVDNVVSSSGTALTEGQIKLIRRFTENVTVLFDGDAAGIKAALRGIDLILKGGLNVRVVLLPDSEDPDSYSRKVGTVEFQKFLAQKAQDFISFKINLVAEEAKRDPIRKSESIIEVINSLAQIPEEPKRAPYYELAARRLGVDAQIIISETNKIRLNTARNLAKKEERESYPEIVQEIENKIVVSPEYRIDVQERESIRLLLNYAENSIEDQKLFEYFFTELDDVKFSNPIYNEIYEEFKKGAAKGEVRGFKYFIDQGREAVKNTVANLTTSRYELSPRWKEKHIYVPDESELLQSMAFTNVLRWKFRLVQKMMEDNLVLIRDSEEANNHEEVEKYLEQQVELKKAERELASVLGIVVAR